MFKMEVDSTLDHIIIRMAARPGIRATTFMDLGAIRALLSTNATLECVLGFSGSHEYSVEIELAWSIFASPDSLAPFECHTNFPSIYILTAHLFRHYKYLYIAPGNPRSFAHI